MKPAPSSAGFNFCQLAASTQLKEAIFKDFLYRKSRTGEVIRVATDRFYPRATLAQLAAIAKVVAEGVTGGQFTPAQYRDGTGIGRSLAMEILKALDRLGIIKRIGDVCKMRKDFVPILGPATARPSLAANSAKATAAKQDP